MSKLVPTQVNDDTLGEVLFDGIRRRPVVAINQDGEQVVCAARTARKHGWTIETKYYSRTPAPKKTEKRKEDLKAVEDLLK